MPFLKSLCRPLARVSRTRWPTPSPSPVRFHGTHASEATAMPDGYVSSAAFVAQGLQAVQSGPTGPGSPRVIEAELSHLVRWVQTALGTDVQTARLVGGYYFRNSGKFLRPALLLLIAQATSRQIKTAPAEYATMRAQMDEPFDPDMLASYRHLPLIDSLFLSNVEDSLDVRINPFQRRVAYSIEILHTATLLHDDVADGATTRRGAPAANIAFKNKEAVLTGDFMMARAIDWMTKTGNLHAQRLISHAIANLALGEMIQLSDMTGSATGNINWTPGVMDHYIRKSYLKTASLIALSAKATAVLALEPQQEYATAAFEYGKNLGISFQLIDDLLDYTSDEATLGKPVGADLHLGLATGPVLYAWEKFPELGPVVMRRFSEPGDVEMALDCVSRSDGIERTRQLAQSFATKAVDSLAVLPDTESKEVLIKVAATSVDRKK